MAPTSHDHGSTASALGGGIWSNSTAAAPLQHGSLAGGPAYGSDAHLLSLLGVSDAGSTAAAPAGGFGAVGGFDALQPSSSSAAFDQRPLASGSSGSLLPFPGGGQPAFSGLPAAASLWGGSSAGGLGAGLAGSGEQLVR